MELALFGLWCFLVAAAGGLVGLVLGNLRLPATVVVGTSAAAGAGANLAISAIAAATAAIAHVRAGRVNWRLFAWTAPPSILGAIAGGLASGALPDDVLLAVIGLTLFVFGVDILRPKARAGAPEEPDADGPDLTAIVLTGAAIGVLGGLVGLILGTLRLPALLRFAGDTAQRVVGTNLTVGVCVGAAGIVGHAPSGVDWTLLAVGAAASVPGAVLGARLTGRLSKDQLLRAIGVILVAAGLTALAQGVF